MNIEIETLDQALAALNHAWETLIIECQDVLAGELHYQNMLYHALRTAGVPHTQLGMNVRQHIGDPVTELYQRYSARKSEGYRRGFECIPDAVIFSNDVNGDWRRRSASWSVKHMLLAIEVKASERHRSRLGLSEIMTDIKKLVAHRQEVAALGNREFLPVMMVIDVAPEAKERMRPEHVEACSALAKGNGVVWLYMDRGT